MSPIRWHWYLQKFGSVELFDPTCAKRHRLIQRDVLETTRSNVAEFDNASISADCSENSNLNGGQVRAVRAIHRADRSAWL